jgi:hypothetical protein
VKIYLAGASAEASKCKALADWAQRFGHTITVAWWDQVLASKTHDRDLTAAAREEFAKLDTVGVVDADILWIAIPEERGIGAWIEFGIKLGILFLGGSHRTREWIIASGDWRKTIFTSLAHERFDTHEEALVWLQKMGEEPAA